MARAATLVPASLVASLTCWHWRQSESVKLASGWSNCRRQMYQIEDERIGCCKLLWAFLALSVGCERLLRGVKIESAIMSSLAIGFFSSPPCHYTTLSNKIISHLHERDNCYLSIVEDLYLFPLCLTLSLSLARTNLRIFNQWGDDNGMMTKMRLRRRRCHKWGKYVSQLALGATSSAILCFRVHRSFVFHSLCSCR